MNVLVKCHCCDNWFLFPKQILDSMKAPSTFCTRCYYSFDFMTLRKWWILDMLIQHVQQLDQRLAALLRPA